MKAKRTMYRGKHFSLPTFRPMPLAFSTCGDYSASVNDFDKDPGKLRAEMEEDNLLADDTGKLGLQARETGCCGDIFRSPCKRISPIAPSASKVGIEAGNAGRHARK